ncbi:MAG: PAS domain S-box protein, partial [Candidatus Thermoplasmatota archaeon]
MNLNILTSLFSAITTLFIASYILLSNHKKKTNVIFSLLLLYFAVFSTTEILVRTSNNVDSALLWGRIGYSVLAIAPIIAIHFSYLYPRNILDKKTFILKNKDILKILYPTSLLVYFLFNLLISNENVTQSSWGYRVILGGDITIFILAWFLCCVFFAAINFIKIYLPKKTSLNKFEKKQIKSFALGLILVAFLSIITNILSPYFETTIFPMASSSLLLFSIILAYSMIKYRFMELSPNETADILIDTMSDSMIVTNEQQKIVNVNKSALNLLKYNHEEIKGKNLQNFLSFSKEKKQNYKQLHNKPKEKISTEKNLHDTEAYLHTKNGKLIPVSISSSPIYKKGNLRGFLITARDQTEIKRLVKELQQSKENLEEKVQERTKELKQTNKDLLETKQKLIQLNEHLEDKVKEKTQRIEKLLKQKEEFIDQLGHDLKNPLTPLLTLLPLMKRETQNEKFKEYLEVSLNSVKFMEKLVKKTLYLAKLNSSKIDFDFKNINLQKITQKLEKKHNFILNEKNIELNNQIKDDITVKADPLRLEEIFDNLITNAVKFTPKGGEISLSAEQKEDKVRIAV